MPAHEVISTLLQAVDLAEWQTDPQTPEGAQTTRIELANGEKYEVAVTPLPEDTTIFVEVGA